MRDAQAPVIFSHNKPEEHVIISSSSMLYDANKKGYEIPACFVDKHIKQFQRHHLHKCAIFG